MFRIIFSLLLLSPCLEAFSQPVKIKDLITIKGVRDNPLLGYGLVIGLNGTGDGGGEIQNTSFKKILKDLGLDLKTELASKNIASVIVTASLPPFARSGQKIDATISAINGASSLAGGTLLITPLKGGDGKIYAIATGQLSIGGLKKGAKFSTSARIPSGAVVEKEFELNFDEKNSLRFSLNQPDFTTSARVARVINQELGGKFATSKDATTIDLIVPDFYQKRIVDLISIIENFSVNPDHKAKIVINEKTGTIVAGGSISISPVALSHDNLTVKISQEKDAKGALPGYAHQIQKSTTIDDLVKVLNNIGATPEDMISIFQTLQKNGALRAEIELI